MAWCEAFIAVFSAIISFLVTRNVHIWLLHRPTLKCILFGIDDMPQLLLERVAVALRRYSMVQDWRHFLSPRCYDLSVVAVGTADEIDHGTDVVIACAPQVTSSREPPPISVACILSVGPSTCGSLSVVTDGHDHVRLLDLTTRDTFAFVLQRCDAAQKVRCEQGYDGEDGPLVSLSLMSKAFLVGCFAGTGIAFFFLLRFIIMR